MSDLENKLIEYCQTYNVPIDYLFEILEDQKVVPMIRGKATEYNVYSFLESNLSKYTWSVQKLNLNAQNGLNDEDISLTHRKSGVILKVESKNACRGSFSDGRRARLIKEPHFKVKCHRSRSNIKLANTSNDRYSVDDFDLIVCNTSNALYEGNTIESLEILHNKKIVQTLHKFYNTNNDKELINSCNNDWRFVIPSDIAEDGYIPRTPYVKLSGDPNWFGINQLEERLLIVVEEKRKQRNSNSRR